MTDRDDDGLTASEALDRIAARDFREWQGLPVGARYADLDARFPRVTDAEAVGLLGARLVSARYRMHVAEGYRQNLKVWFAADQLLVVDAALPELAHPLGELRADLGEPELRLDSVWGVMTLPAALQVYPNRGLALLIGPEEQVLRLLLFAAGSGEDFVERVHTESRLVERPLNGAEGPEI